jgi:transcriptional regulator with XRE-family HTH domain
MWHICGTVLLVRYGEAESGSTEIGQVLAAVGPALEDRGRSLRQSAAFDLGVVREVVRVFDHLLAELNEAAGIEEELAWLIRESALQSSSTALLHLRAGEPDAAVRLLFDTWRQTAQSLGIELPPLAGAVGEATSLYLSFSSGEAQELLATFRAAVFEHCRISASQAGGREVLRRLMTLLGLSYDQLGRAFSVSGETVRRWERGSHPIPDERLPDLTQADSALSRLLHIFRPDRLLQVVRRKAELFEGETGLSWILRGRIADVAGRYETALAFQG